MKASTNARNIVLALSAILLALILGEIAVRVLLPPPYRIRSRKPSSMKAMPRFAVDSDIGWVNAPEDATYHFVSTGPNGTTNAIYHMHGGFRDTSATPVTGPMLVMAGCSFSFGMGVNDADTWPWMVQEQMQGYQIVNAATSAYNVAQALMRANRVVGQNPGKVKTVLLAYGDFDVERDRAPQRDLVSLYPWGRPRFLKADDGIKRAGVVRFWTPGPLVERSALAMSVINLVAEFGNKTPSREDAREIEARLIDDFYKQWTARGIAFGVVILPWGSDTLDTSKTNRNFIIARLRDFHIPTFVPDFPRSPDGTIDKMKYLIASDAFHPNRDYNLIFSRSARQSLESLAGTPGPK